MEDTNIRSLKIELLSDMCLYSGDIYNSLVDIDVVYDCHGLPYIPAKRIKGCIREAYIELMDFEQPGYTKQECDKIFGCEENGNASFTIGNAYLPDYDMICNDLNSCGDVQIKNTQNVLDLYSYIRTQTAVDNNTGTAKENSLRSMRVIKKGTSFLAPLYYKDNSIAGHFEEAAKLVKHMGLRRTRGMGIVNISFINGENQSDGNQSDGAGYDQLQYRYYDNNRISYRLELKSSVRCKSAEGNETKSNDYIEGSKVLGLIVRALGSDEFKKIADNIIVSNAYIECNSVRSVPVSASLQKEKDQTYASDESMQVYDMIYASASDIEGRQMEPVEEKYIVNADGYNIVKKVQTRISYHHKRPDDKSIGRAIQNDDSTFYQLESINENQAFRGNIYVNNRDTAKIVVEALMSLQDIRIGNGRNAEFGDVTLQIRPEDITKINKNSEVMATEFVVNVDSPVVMYNENGMLSSDVKTLEAYIRSALGLDVLDQSVGIDRCFLKYETVGGYNVTWNARKPVFTAIGRGSVCHFKCARRINISQLSESSFIGERVSEGFGEIHVTCNGNGRVILRKESADNSIDASDKSGIISELKKAAVLKHIRNDAREKANKLFADIKESGIDNLNAIVGRLILVSLEQKTVNDMSEQVEMWESEDKRVIAARIVRSIKDIIDHSGMEESCIYNSVCQEYLTCLKYNVRTAKREN